MLDIFDNIDCAILKLYDMVNLEEERGRPYFVDNDFFDNRYNIAIKLKYFCIKEREVTKWEKFSEKSLSNISGNILYFNNYINL